MERILVPVDFSACSRRALAFARALAVPEDAEIHLLHVYPATGGPGAGRGMAEGRSDGKLTRAEIAYRDAEREMDAFVSETGVPDDTSHLLSGSPGRRILEFAEQGAFDLIVMGTHGRTGIQRLIMGSVAEYVVRHASCPVLSIHPEDAMEPPSGG